MFYCPHRPNRWEEGGLEFGAFIAENPKDDNDFVAKKIDKNYQEFDRLRASPEAVAAIKKMVGAGQKLIAIFPRERKMRRPDKNWAREKYDHLIALFQRTYPEHTVALLGEPGAACYANGVPEGCLDLINVESTRRMDLHVAALNKLSVIAVGSQSGALFLAQAAGCPSLTWGGDRMKTFHPIPEKVQEDRFGTPFIYHRESNPSEETIYALAQGMIERKIPPKNRARWSSFDYFGVRGVFMRFGYHSRIWWM